MPRPELVTKWDLEEAILHLSRRRESVPSNQEIAEYLGKKKGREFTANYISKAKMRHGLNIPLLSHRDVIPWRLLPEDMKSKEAQYLRVLGALAKGEDRPKEAVAKSLNWLRRHVKDLEDVKYVALAPLGQRWQYPKAEMNDWHLKRVLDMVEGGSPIPKWTNIEFRRDSAEGHFSGIDLAPDDRAVISVNGVPVITVNGDGTVELLEKSK
jgi:hypothetical protein